MNAILASRFFTAHDMMWNDFSKISQTFLVLKMKKIRS